MNGVDSKGRTAFYNICRHCCPAVVEEAIKLGGKHDNGGKKGKQPLFGACRTRNIGAVNILLENGADPNALTESNYSPLWVSARDGMADVVEALVKHGADPNWVDERSNIDCVTVACSEGNAETALALLGGTIPYNVANVETEGSTALWVSAAEGYADVVAALLDLGADPNRANNYMRTPLMAAALQGHHDVCKMLLDNGADMNLADENKETALYIACSSGHSSIAKVLLASGATDLNEGNAEGETPLITASWHGHQEIVEALLAHGADVDKQNANGKTPLIAACWRSFPDAAKALISAHASAHKVDEHGRTALWAACRGGSAACVQVVLDHGGDPDQMDDRKGAFDAGAGVSSCTPLFAAAWQGHLEVVECMLKNGCDPELGDNEHRKPLDVADKDAIKAIIRQYADMKYAGTAPPPCSGKGAFAKQIAAADAERAVKIKIKQLQGERETAMKRSSELRTRMEAEAETGKQGMMMNELQKLDATVESLTAELDKLIAKDGMRSRNKSVSQRWSRASRISKMNLLSSKSARHSIGGAAVMALMGPKGSRTSVAEE